MIRRAVSIEVDSDYMNYLTNSGTINGERGEVVMVLRRPGNRVLAMSKCYYPDGVFRLPTGAIQPIESTDEAFARETWEETGLKPETWERIAVVVHRCSCGSRTLDVTSHIIAGDETRDVPSPTDTSERISDYKEVNADDLLWIADHLRSLFGRWEGFGKLRAVAHEIVADYLRHGRIL